jgi:cysteine dioxygenase
MKTLCQLAEQISAWIEVNGVENFHISHFMKQLQNYNGEDWKKCPQTCKPCYFRYVQQINIKYHNTVYDMIIISWGPNCATPVHNHPETGCIFKVLEGELVEELYDATKDEFEPLKITSLKVGDTGYIDDSIGFHRVVNRSNKQAVSLHIYETGYSPDTFECFDCPQSKL